MKKYLTDALKKVVSFLLTQETGNSFRESVYKFKNRYKRIYRLLYGTADDRQIFDNIVSNIEVGTEILMVHSSFKSMIPMYVGNPNKLLSLLLEYCKDKNITLAMPTFFLGSNYQARQYYENEKHFFDVNKTFSQMGLITELFRRTKDVARSMHPTHSICALGPLAETLLRNHHICETTFGEGTPFAEMIRYKTIILGIGTDRYVLTQVHTTEDIMKNEFPIDLFSSRLPITCIDVKGNSFTYHLRIRKKDYIIDKKSFDSILNNAFIKEWTYKGIPFFLCKARVVTETLIEAAKKGQTIYKKKK